MHEHDINCEPMQPSGKSGFAAEGSDLAEKLKEGFLSKVLRFRGVPGHPQTERVNTPLVHFEERGKCLLVSVLCARNQLSLGRGLRSRRLLLAQGVSLPAASRLAWCDAVAYTRVVFIPA
jgi:hypothetical protein